jgi:hypothetical protein
MPPFEIHRVNARTAPTLEGEEISIVLIGDFNAKIFHPAWFALEGLIRRSEAEEAVVEIVHRDVASFRLDWVAVDVGPDRFSAKIRSAAFRISLRDLVAGTFSTLRHTPTRQLGINLTKRFRFPTDADWHNFGHYLAPKSPWKGLLAQPGMRAIHVQGTRPDHAPGHVLVTAEPNVPSLVSIRVNDHYEAPQGVESESATGTLYFVDKIATDFEQSLQRADHLIEGLIAGFLTQKGFDDGTH